jgi:hypothetical protein
MKVGGSQSEACTSPHSPQKCKPLSENITKAGGMAQVVKHLPSKHGILNSNPSTAIKKKYIYIYICIFIFDNIISLNSK